MAKTIETGNIGEYVSHNDEQLITEAFLTSDIMEDVDMVTGVKYKEAVTILDLTPQATLSSCGFSKKGKTNLSERIIEVSEIDINMGWCSKDLNKIWMQKKTNTRAGADVLPFAEEFIAEILKKNRMAEDIRRFQGDKASDNELINLYDGWLKFIKAESVQVSMAKAFTPANAYSIVQAIALAIPNEIVVGGEAVIYMPISMFRIYQQALTDKNMYHVSGKENGTFQLYVPNTNILVKGEAGLEGSKTIIGCNPKNLVFGTDLANDSESIDFYFEKSAGEHRLEITYKAGTQVKFPDEIVYWVEA